MAWNISNCVLDCLPNNCDAKVNHATRGGDIMKKLMIASALAMLLITQDYANAFSFRFWEHNGGGRPKNYHQQQNTPQPVPEPSTLALIGMGMVGVWVAKRFKK